MEKQLKTIMFAGASGVGKTTLAKQLAECPVECINFISGSVSDLLPSTKEMEHKDMLARDPKDLYMEDYQIINLRKKIFEEKISEGQNFVSDRSFLDSAAYFIYKQADKLPACEIEHFVNLCKMLTSTLCSHLIIIDFDTEMLREWITEDNKKRITNNYFQMEITQIMKMVIDIWGVKWPVNINQLKGGFGGFTNRKNLEKGATAYDMNTIYGTTKVLIVHEVELEIRNKLIWQFINA